MAGMTTINRRAALFALFFIVLSLRVAAMRRSTRVSLGDGSNAAMQRLIRAHGNFGEYVPLLLILMALLVFGLAGGWVLAMVAYVGLLVLGLALRSGSALVAALVLAGWLGLLEGVDADAEGAQG